MDLELVCRFNGQLSFFGTVLTDDKDNGRDELRI